MNICRKTAWIFAMFLLASCEGDPGYEGDGIAISTRAGIFSGYQVVFPRLVGDHNAFGVYRLLKARSIGAPGYLTLRFDVKSETDFNNPLPMLDGCIFQLDVVDAKGNYILQSTARRPDLHQAVGPELWPAKKNVEVFKDDWKLSPEDLSRLPLKITFKVDQDRIPSCSVREGFQLVLAVGGVK